MRADNLVGKLLLKRLRHRIVLPKKELKSVPFPLQYQLLSTDIPGKAHLSAEDIKLEERRLATAVKELTAFFDV